MKEMNNAIEYILLEMENVYEQKCYYALVCDFLQKDDSRITELAEAKEKYQKYRYLYRGLRRSLKIVMHSIGDDRSAVEVTRKGRDIASVQAQEDFERDYLAVTK